MLEVEDDEEEEEEEEEEEDKDLEQEEEERESGEVEQRRDDDVGDEDPGGVVFGGGRGGGWRCWGFAVRFSGGPRVPKIRSISGSSRDTPFHLFFKERYSLLFLFRWYLLLSFLAVWASMLRKPLLFFPVLYRVGSEGLERENASKSAWWVCAGCWLPLQLRLVKEGGSCAVSRPASWRPPVSKKDFSTKG